MAHFYGDNLRWWVGQVLQQHPSQNMVRVKIHGLHTSAMTEMDHPWATIMIPSTEGGTSGIGRISQINKNAYVFGIFLDGKTSQSPMVLGTLTQTEMPTQDQIDQLPSGVEGSPVHIDRTSIGTDGLIVDTSLRASYARYRTDTSTNGTAAKRLIAMLFLTRQLNSDDKPMFTPEQAAGIVGNLQGENNTFDPTLQSGIKNPYRTQLGKGFGDPDREPSYGIAQWNANVGRYQNLLGFSASLGAGGEPWDDFFVQLRFIIHELTGKYGNGGSTYNSTYLKLIQTTTHRGYPNNGKYNTVNSTWVWLDKYENPGGKKDLIAKREEFAIAALEDYYREIQNTGVAE